MTWLTLTVTFFHAPVFAPFIKRPNPAITWGISDIFGGTSSTFAYFINVANLGLELSTAPNHAKKEVN